MELYDQQTTEDHPPLYKFCHFDDLKCPVKTLPLKVALLKKFEHFNSTLIKYQDHIAVSIKTERTFPPIYEAWESFDQFMSLALKHMTFVHELLKTSTPEEGAKVRAQFAEVSDKYPGLDSSEDISLVTTLENLNFLEKGFFGDLNDVVRGIEAGKHQDKIFHRKNSFKNLLLVIASKINDHIGYFPSIPQLSKHVVFSETKYSDTWKKLQEVVEMKTIVSEKAIQESLNSFNTVVSTFFVIHYKKNQDKAKGTNSTLSGVKSVGTGLCSVVNKKDAQLIAELSIAQSELANAFTVWNMLDQKWAKRIRRLTLKKNKLEKKFYLPRLFPRITKEKILQEYEDGTLQKIIPNGFVAPDLVSQKEHVKSDILIKNTERVRVRLISTETNKHSRNKSNYKGIIVHVHGGGFVSMSSSVYREALARYAKGIGLPVFSIDYGLAPEVPYPGGLDDVWQAYNWIINYCETILDISTERIIMVGDSAGGNLALTTTLRAIKEGIRVPDGCFLAYPALNTNTKNLTPSYFFAFKDMLLPYKLLALCMEAYVPKEMKPESDPFLSPVQADLDLIAKLPPIRIGTGNRDPLHDDVWTLIYKMQKMEKDIKVIVYKGLPHGYNSLDLPNQEVLENDALNFIHELFVLAQNKKLEESRMVKSQDMTSI